MKICYDRYDVFFLDTPQVTVKLYHKEVVVGVFSFTAYIDAFFFVGNKRWAPYFGYGYNYYTFEERICF